MSDPNDVPKRVLIVDDEAEVRARFSEAMEEDGWSVAVCGDGAGVNEAVREFNPTVVLLDLKMPKKDGAVVLEELRKCHPWTQVVIVTGHGDEDDAINCLNHGAFRYLRKPVSIGTLYENCESARANVPPVLSAIYSWYRSLPEPDKVVFNTASGRAITANALMNEVRNQTDLGQEFVQKVMSLAAELVVKRLK
jgi:DNA-binding response OmpR family regulator